MKIAVITPHANSVRFGQIGLQIFLNGDRLAYHAAALTDIDLEGLPLQILLKVNIRENQVVSAKYVTQQWLTPDRQ